MPARDAVIGDFAPQQATVIAEPNWTFGPQHVGGGTLDTDEQKAVLGEARSRISMAGSGYRSLIFHCAKIEDTVPAVAMA
jgi:hypothetical protein